MTLRSAGRFAGYHPYVWTNVYLLHEYENRNRTNSLKHLRVIGLPIGLSAVAFRFSHNTWAAVSPGRGLTVRPLSNKHALRRRKVTARHSMQKNIRESRGRKHRVVSASTAHRRPRMSQTAQNPQMEKLCSRCWITCGTRLLKPRRSPIQSDRCCWR